MTTEIFNVTLTRWKNGSIPKLVKDLQKDYPPTPKAMNREQAVSKISRPIIKKTGLW